MIKVQTQSPAQTWEKALFEIVKAFIDAAKRRLTSTPKPRKHPCLITKSEHPKRVKSPTPTVLLKDKNLPKVSLLRVRCGEREQECVEI